MRQTLVSYGGNAYGYQQLIAPKTGVGFGNPAKDVWAYMVSVLVAQVDLHQFEGREQILSTEVVSMRPEKQRSHTAVDFVNWHLYVHTTSSNPFPTFDSSLYDKNTADAKRKAIYNTMVLGSLKYHKHDSNLAKKLGARGLPTVARSRMWASPTLSMASSPARSQTTSGITRWPWSLTRWQLARDPAMQPAQAGRSCSAGPAEVLRIMSATCWAVTAWLPGLAGLSAPALGMICTTPG